MAQQAEQAGYNGWKNYETWNVALWIGNEQGSYNYWQDATREALDNAEASEGFTKQERAAIDLSNRLQAEIKGGNPLANTCSMYSDILSAALSDVYWYEIAKNWVDDMADAQDDEPNEDDRCRVCGKIVPGCCGECGCDAAKDAKPYPCRRCGKSVPFNTLTDAGLCPKCDADLS